MIAIVRDLVNKHFGRGNYLTKIFNKNTLKISYSCLPNLKAKINAHNKSLLNKVASDSGQKECNCQRSRECPLQGNCVVKDVVYKAVIRTPNQEEGEGHTYLGLASGLVKLRISNHYRSFNNPALRSG